MPSMVGPHGCTTMNSNTVFFSECLRDAGTTRYVELIVVSPGRGHARFLGTGLEPKWPTSAAVVESTCWPAAQCIH